MSLLNSKKQLNSKITKKITVVLLKINLYLCESNFHGGNIKVKAEPFNSIDPSVRRFKSDQFNFELIVKL